MTQTSFTPQDQRALYHDLSQYVAAAMLVSAMPEDDQLDLHTRHRFAIIHHQLLQLDTVLRDCLTGGADAGTADVVQLVRDCVRAASARRRVELRTEVGAAEATGDHVALRRALNNLLDNAARAEQSEESILVRVSATPHQVTVEVRDHGLGFGRIRGGAGLGMVSVTTALSSFDGALEISSGPGPGTAVRLVLPRASS